MKLVVDSSALAKRLLNDVRDAVILQITSSVISHSGKVLFGIMLPEIIALRVGIVAVGAADTQNLLHRVAIFIDNPDERSFYEIEAAPIDFHPAL